MKFILPGLAAAALIWTPVAHAQVACADVQKLLAEANSDFTSLKQEDAEIDLDIFESAFTLPDSTGCVVSYEWNAVHICYWSFASSDAAVAFVEKNDAPLAKCLGGGWIDTVLEDSGESEWALLAGYTFEGEGKNKDRIVALRADTLEDGDEFIYEAELSVAAIPEDW